METSFRIVLAGCGSMANTWVEYALQRQDARIVALVDLREEAAKNMLQKYNLTCPIFTELERAIEQTDANVVFDCTIPDAHFQIASTAMRSGCDVFAEKPLAVSMKEGRKLVQLSDETGRSLSIMQNRRFDPNIRALRQLLANGTIGKPGYVGADFFLGPHFGGFREQMASPLLLDMAIHTFDQARFILGSDPVNVYCHEFNPAGSWYEGNAAAICIFEMSDGSVFCYRGSWCAEGAPTSWEATWRITGETGTIIWDGNHPPYAEIVEDQEEIAFFRKTRRIDAPNVTMKHKMHSGCLDEMFASLTANRRAETDCRDNIKSLAMVFGAMESAKSGRKIEIDSML